MTTIDELLRNLPPGVDPDVVRAALSAQPSPVAAQPVAAQPVAAQPVAAQPVAAQPVAAQPVAAQPVAAQPRRRRARPPAGEIAMVVPHPVTAAPVPAGSTDRRYDLLLACACAGLSADDAAGYLDLLRE